LYAWNAHRAGEDINASDAFVAAGVGALAGGMIGTGVGMLASGSVGIAGAITGSATVSEVAAVTMSTGAGIASSAAGYLGANIISKSPFDSTDFSITSSVGAPLGAFGPIYGSTPVSSGIMNAAAGALDYELSYLHHNNELDFSSNFLLNSLSAGFIGAISPSSPIETIDYANSRLFHQNGRIIDGIRWDPCRFAGNNLEVVTQRLFGPPSIGNFVRTGLTTLLGGYTPNIIEEIIQ